MEKDRERKCEVGVYWLCIQKQCESGNILHSVFDICLAIPLGLEDQTNMSTITYLFCAELWSCLFIPIAFSISASTNPAESHSTIHRHNNFTALQWPVMKTQLGVFSAFSVYSILYSYCRVLKSSHDQRNTRRCIFCISDHQHQ